MTENDNDNYDYNDFDCYNDFCHDCKYHLSINDYGPNFNQTPLRLKLMPLLKNISNCNESLI